MKNPKAPCYKDGKDCEKRKVGCRSSCEEWQTYEKEHSEYLQERGRIKAIDTALYEIAAERGDRLFRRVKRKVR